MAVRVGRGYMGKCGRVPLGAEGQECLEARAERGPYKPRQPRAISNWTCPSAFLERMPRQTCHLHAHAVNRSVCGEKQRLHVRSAEGEIGRNFGGLDRADMGAVRRVNPGAAG